MNKKCKVHYFTTDSDEMQNIKVEYKGRRDDTEIINTLLIYLLSENKVLKRIVIIVND